MEGLIKGCFKLKLIITACVVTFGLLTALFELPVLTHAATGVPKSFSYQGRLYDSSGNLLGGTGTAYCFKFSIYDNATVGSGTKLWPAGAPTGASISVRYGVFNANVGLDTPDALTYNFADNDTVYLQVEAATKVGALCTDGDETYETLGAVSGGRQQIVSSGYAINAGNALGAVTPNNAAGASTGFTAQSGTGTTGTGAITLLTGNASAGTAGNVAIDVGTSTSSNGSILIGTAARAQTITIGNSSGGTITVGATSGSDLALQDAQWSVTGAGVANFITGSVIGSQTFTTNNIADSGALTIASGTAVNNLAVRSGNNAGGASGSATFSSGTGTTASGAVALNSGNASAGTAGNITLDVGTSSSGNGSILIGGAARAQTLTIGNTTAGTAVNLQAPTLTIGDTATTNTIKIGGVTNSGTDTVSISTNATAADILSIGSTHASSTLTLEGGSAANAIQIANGGTAHGIQIGAGAAVQTIIIGSNNTTSKLTLNGGNISTTTGTGGVHVGSDVTDANAVQFQLDSYNTFANVASSCAATVNQGAIYYNSSSAEIRACIDGGWQDLVSTGVLGLQMFGVVPDSGANPGDLLGVTDGTAFRNGPCKVSVGANTTTISWTACIAYSGGRKVQVTAGTAATVNTVANNFQHLCLTAANNQPALSTTGSEVANLATVSLSSVNDPILCLADVKYTGANNTITQIYDTRTYTTTQKETVSIGTTAPALGHLVQYSATRGVVIPMATLNGNNLAGVVVASTGATATTTINGIIATAGPAAVKAITGTNVVGAYIFGSATAGYASTVATKPTEGTGTIYNLLGNARTAWTGATACAANSDACAGSIFTSIDKR